MAKVFVSHAGADLTLASELHDWLIDQGHDVFLDQDLVHGLDAGEDWEQQLHERLRWADAVVCIVTSDFVKSTWCAAEVGISRSRGSRVLPVVAELGVTYPLLPSTQHTPYASDPVGARQSLAESLRRVDLAGAQGWRDGLNPFPGLRAFDADMRSVFFGRKGETKALATLLRSQAGQADARVLLVVGPSGCGKSSMVRAGLLPLIAEEPGWWTLPPLVPGSDPVGGLALQLAIAARQLKLAWTVTATRERLDRDDRALNLLAEELLLATPDPSRPSRLLLFVDQFEELLTQADPSGRTRFSTLLRSALDGPVQVVGTLRPEFLEQLLANEELEGLPVQTFPLRSLQRERLRTVIEEPADRAGITVDRDLVDRLVNDTDSGEALPLLAFTLSQLAEGVERNGHLSSARYDEIGGVKGALTHQADAALADAEIGGLARSEVIGALLWLVTVDEQGAPTRRRLNREHLPVGVSAALSPFVDRRLVSTDTDNGSVVIQVAHEAFLSAWPPLAEAINASASALRYRREVEQSAAEWAAHDRAKSHLWERGRLAATVDAVGAHLGHANRLDGWSSPSPAQSPSEQSPRRRRPWTRRMLMTDKVELEPQAREFLAASIRQDRRARRRTTTFLTSALVLALVAAGIGFTQQRAAQLQQRIATSRQLVTQAEAARIIDPRAALRLGIAAQRVHSDVDTRVSLFNTLASSDYAGALPGFAEQVESVTFAPSGHIMATGSQTSVILWDVSDPGRPRRLGPTPKGLTNAAGPVAFAPDGRTLVTGNIDNYIVIQWDVSDPVHPKRLGPPLKGNSQLSAISFAPDGHTLAIGGWEDTVTLWDISKSGPSKRISTPGKAKAAKPSEMPVAVDSVAFSRDGHTLAAGSNDGTVTMWNISNTRQPNRLGSPVKGTGIGKTTFTPDMRALATTNSDDVTLSDVTNPRKPTKLSSLPSTDVVNSIAFAPSGKTLATSDDKTVVLWDVKNPRRPLRLNYRLRGHTGPVISVAFAPNGRTLATSGEDKTVILWNINGKDQPQRLGIPVKGQAGMEYLRASAPDLRTIVTIAGNDLLSVWDVSDLARPRRLGAPLKNTEMTTSVKFSPNGDTLAATAERGVILWDVSAGSGAKRRSKPIPIGDANVNAIGFAPDGHTLAIDNMDSLTLWDVSKNRPLKQLGSAQVHIGGSSGSYSMAFTPNGHTLSTAGPDNTVILWDTSKPGPPKQLGSPLEGHGGQVQSMAFAPNGSTLATSSDDSTVILWDVSAPAHPKRLGSPLTGYARGAPALAFAPDGRTLATGDEDAVILWDVSDPGTPMRLNSQLAGAPMGFIADGRTLVTTASNTTMVLWDLKEFNYLRDHALAQACKQVNALNPTEWSRYVSGLPYSDTCPN